MSKKIRAVAICLSLCLLVLPIMSCASCKNKRVVATCGEYDIYYEYLRFVTLNFKDQLESAYGDGNAENGTIWDDPKTAAQYKPLLEERVWGLIRDNYAVLMACAEYGIGRDVFDGKEVKKAVDAQMDALKSTYDSYLEYEQALADSYMTEDVFRFHYAIEEMKVRLYRAMADAGEFIDDEETFHEWLADGNYAYVQHILREVSEGEDAEIERDMAESVRAGLREGRYDVEWYINNLNDDLTNVSPYFMVRHAYDDALVDAALALENVGDVSPVIEVDGNFYVLMLQDESEGDLSSQLTTLLSAYQWGVVSEKVADVRDGMKIEMTKFGKKIDLLEIE
ncbi:MAG: hypothetical protein IJW29_09990 [Clostridia bacterium]|nr:hypothetical protein [Clostridia bacterium]MBQ9785820.1 hypothetical protein [Clostridia bacterium]